MVDINNLNRIRGILSARQGAEIPKFQNPAGPISFNTTIGIDDPGFKQFKQGANLLGSYQDLNTYITLKEKYPQATSEQLVQYYKGKTPQTTAIPGANPDQNNPNAAVEASAAQNEATQQAQQQIIAEQKATQTPIQTAPLPMAGLNAAPASDLKIPDKITLSTEAQAAIDHSAGMNIAEIERKRKQKELDKASLHQAKGQLLSGINQGVDALGSVVGAGQAVTDSNTTKTVNAAYDGIANLASSFGPIGQAVGSVMKIADVAGDAIQAMGGGTDQQTTMDKWMDSSFFSWNIGMLNGFAGKNTQDFGVDQDILASVGSSYGGTASDLNDSAEKAGKKYGLFSSKARKKADAAINSAKAKQNLMGDISDTASDQRLAVQSMGEQTGLAYSMMTGGGYDQKYTYAAKHGGLLEWNPVIELKWEPQIELNWELPSFKEGGNLEFFEELEWIPEFKEGGKTKEFDIPEIEETNQKNVIPEGALHKNKHHMEHAEGLTKKGIPVIDEDGEQQAEIEHSEIIFTLEVTKKLEEYYEIFYSESASNKEKEQAALEAGKLLVYQILENTEDRTGLIESCKKGGTLNFKKSTEDLIEEALEWIPTITIIEEVIEEVKEEEKPKKKSEKEQMKEAIKEVLIELLTK